MKSEDKEYEAVREHENEKGNGKRQTKMMKMKRNNKGKGGMEIKHKINTSVWKIACVSKQFGGHSLSFLFSRDRYKQVNSSS